MNMRHLALFLFLVVFTACQSDGTPGWQELNLMRYNIPVAIMAPDSAKVKMSEVSGIVRDVTIEDEENDFLVQIFSGKAFTNDVARLKSSQLELVRDNPYFNRIVKEDPTGFIFENKIDSTSAFGFRHVIYQGDLEIIMQNGMGRIFGQEAVEKMYESVTLGGEE